MREGGEGSGRERRRKEEEQEEEKRELEKEGRRASIYEICSTYVVIRNQLSLT